jgi:hypothetical protein
MKRISDFEDCRMDMKNMAALNGGATNGSRNTLSYQGSGDLMKITYKDAYYIFNGEKREYEYGYSTTILWPEGDAPSITPLVGIPQNGTAVPFTGEVITATFL